VGAKIVLLIIYFFKGILSWTNI